MQKEGTELGRCFNGQRFILSLAAERSQPHYRLYATSEEIVQLQITNDHVNSSNGSMPSSP